MKLFLRFSVKTSGEQPPPRANHASAVDDYRSPREPNDGINPLPLSERMSGKTFGVQRLLCAGSTFLAVGMVPSG